MPRDLKRSEKSAPCRTMNCAECEGSEPVHLRICVRLLVFTSISSLRRGHAASLAVHGRKPRGVLRSLITRGKHARTIGAEMMNLSAEAIEANGSRAEG